MLISAKFQIIIRNPFRTSPM